MAARAKEATSHSGAAMVLLAAMHIQANPDLVNAVLGLVAAIGGLMSILVPEQGNQT
jgi:DNA-binding phage protein